MSGIRARILASIALALTLLLAARGGLDDQGREYANDALKRALVTFAVARTLNGVISVAQETEIAIQPAGVGVTVMPGELLDPINDLIERFSWVMMASTASLGIQSTLLGISGWWGINLALGVSIALMLSALWLPWRFSPATRVLLGRVFAFMLLLRFAVPVLLVLTQLVANAFFVPEQIRATQGLRDTSTAISTINEAARNEPPVREGTRGMLDRFSSFVGERMEAVDIEGRMRQFVDRASHAVEDIIDLIVAFTLETIIVPLAFLWILGRVFSRVTRLS